jgi:hypothetical protein
MKGIVFNATVVICIKDNKREPNGEKEDENP